MSQAEMKRYQVLCHDSRQVVQAQLTKVSPAGAELVTHGGHGAPMFAVKSKIYLEILDEKTGKTEQVYVRLAKAELHQRHWVYVVRWEELPALIA